MQRMADKKTRREENLDTNTARPPAAAAAKKPATEIREEQMQVHLRSIRFLLHPNITVASAPMHRLSYHSPSRALLPFLASAPLWWSSALARSHSWQLPIYRSVVFPGVFSCSHAKVCSFKLPFLCCPFLRRKSIC